MKRAFKKTVSFLLAFVLLAGTSFNSGCAKNKGGDGYGPPIGYIVEKGATEYALMIPASASEALLFAADEFVNFAYQASGALFILVTDENAAYTADVKYISIGRTNLLSQSGANLNYSELKTDGFFIATVGQSVFLDAANDRGIIYAAYDFLEKFFGVRFLTYDHTYVPKDVEVPLYKLNIVENPAFEFRTYLDGSIYIENQNKDYIARMRASSNFTTADDKYGGPITLYERTHDHNYIYFVPREIYNIPGTEQYRPDFYYTDPTYGTTICISNGLTEAGGLDGGSGDIYRAENGYLAGEDISVLAVVIDEMKKDILANPNATNFMFQQMDGPFHCNCENCVEQAGKYMRSGMQIRFCNAMSRELRKWADEKLNGRKFNIVTFAYSYNSDPPINAAGEVLARADDNITMRVAVSANNYYRYNDPDKNTRPAKVFDDWKKCADSFMFWCYDRNYFDYLAYYPTLHTASEDAQVFADYGASYMMIQSVHDDPNNWQSMMASYVWHKLMWNPKADAVVLYNEYIDLHYGAYAGYIRRFIKAYEEHYADLAAKMAAQGNQLKVEHGPGGNYVFAENLPRKLLTNAIDIIKEAEAKLETDASLTNAQKYAMRQRLARVMATPMWGLLKNFDNYYIMATDKEKTAFALEFFRYCELGGVKRVSEARFVESLKSAYGI